MIKSLIIKTQEYQSNEFLGGEGDRWFERNITAINFKNNFENRAIKRILKFHKKSINNILEIGCSNGAKLFDLCNYFGAVGHGIDPSTLAIKYGKNQHSNLHLSVATASNIPYQDNIFDLVYFGFCLYLVDRDVIFQAISEADRVLKPGGFLVIHDFDPNQRQKRAYHHKTGIFSYKTSYSNFFTAGGHYYLVAKESFSHSSNHFSFDDTERVSVCILYKESEAY
jgi:ubiquinone/menaquinone biosynthesis C-methylase UbiE